MASVALLALSLAVLIAVPAAGAPVRVGPGTRLSSIDFEFSGTRTFREKELRRLLVEKPLGKFQGLRKTFSFLPLVSPVEPAWFSPLDLQQDVVRLRDFYTMEGFRGTDIQYAVAHDTEKDLIDVRFLIREGTPVQLSALRVSVTDSAAFQSNLPAGVRRGWENLIREEADQIGRRFGATRREAIEAEIRQWLLDNGFPHVQAASRTEADSLNFTASLDVEVTAGPRNRIGEIAVLGNEGVDADVIRDALPFAPGDWYVERKRAEGQRRLMNLDLFRLVTVEAPPQPVDSTLDLRIRVEEGKPRRLAGEAGYLSEAGITFRGDWTIRNFQGGARSLTLLAVAQTGLWAIDDQPDRLIRGSLSLTQPHVFDPRISLVTGPYVEYRDDDRDRSNEYGLDATLVYASESWLRTSSVKYEVSTQRVLDYRVGSEGASLIEILEAALDSLGEDQNRSALTLASTIGRLDHPVRPRHVFLVRPSLTFTTPGVFNTSEFVKVDLNVSLQEPLGNQVALWLRGNIGRMFPVGKSATVESDVEQIERYLLMQDDLFTAGGSGDVRGWPGRHLGPKEPELVLSPDGDTVSVTADRYIPVGGLARATASVELRLPSPLGEDWGTHVFVDGGQVWTPDPNFVGEDEFDQQRFFASVGTGIDRQTPVGPIRLSVGYMLNPTRLDLLKPQEFLDDLAAGDVNRRDVSWTRYLHVHLAIGASF